MVVNPVMHDILYHELGHAQYGSSMYRGERESIVHVPYTYARNGIYGDDIDTAFSNSISVNKVPLMSLDDAAIDWMVRLNFRNGLEMDSSNTEMDEIRYQHRGHAKYGDMARLFGWQFIKDLYIQESEDIESGIPSSLCQQTLTGSDDRTFRFSLKAEVDLTPLIHFWGIFPENEVGLSACMAQANLHLSPLIKTQLEHYATIVPMNSASFIEFFDNTWPNRRDDISRCSNINYGCGWYNHWYPQWNEALAVASVYSVEAIIHKYWPTTSEPTSLPTSEPTSLPTSEPTSLPTYQQTFVCEDTGSDSFCYSKFSSGGCPHQKCERTCDTCSGGGPSPPPPTPPPASCSDYSGGSNCGNALGGNTCVWEKGSCNPIETRRMRGYVPASYTPRELGLFGASRGPNERASLTAATALWKKKSIRDYEFELEYDLYAPDYIKGPFTVKVENGFVVDVKEKESGKPADSACASDIPTVDELFSRVGDELNSAHYTKVDYSRSTGTPEYIFFNDAGEDDGCDSDGGVVHVYVEKLVHL